MPRRVRLPGEEAGGEAERVAVARAQVVVEALRRAVDRLRVDRAKAA